MSSTGGISSKSDSYIPIFRVIESSITSETDCSLETNYGSKKCYTNCWNTP